MRTTLVIDDDVLAAAREIAEHRGVAIGTVISELSRQGIEATKRPTRMHGRVPTFSGRMGAPPITSEAVLNALDES
jgi:hypothetical protein